jgi:hypothetical protein
MGGLVMIGVRSVGCRQRVAVAVAALISVALSAGYGQGSVWSCLGLGPGRPSGLLR